MVREAGRMSGADPWPVPVIGAPWLSLCSLQSCASPLGFPKPRTSSVLSRVRGRRPWAPVFRKLPSCL